MNVTADPKQNGLLFETIETDGTNVEVTVIVIAFEVAVVVLGQEAVDVITQVMIAPFAIVAGVKVTEFVPAFTPFTFHW